MSRFAQLFDALTRTQSDELRLLDGERIYVLRGGARQDVGKEPVRAASIDVLVAELLPPDKIRNLDISPQTVRVEHEGRAFFVSMRRNAAGVTVAITPEARGPSVVGGGARVTPPIAMPRMTPRHSVPSMPAPTQESEPLISRYGTPEAPEPPRPARTVSMQHAIDEILQEMIEKGASDLHLSSEVRPVLRLHGDMVFMDRPELTTEKVSELLSPLFTQKARADFESKHDADFAYEVPGLARFRVNVFRDRKGVGAVLRQIPIDIIPAEKLGLPKAVTDLCYLSKGLVVVTGPTGSGKSTTLAGMVDYINKNRTDHIITIEDPVEFVHHNIKCLINQREVGQHTHSFKNALRAALREDPDIVLVGEMRDLETVSIAMETAETGHLVFGTLHTTTAMSTIDRIIDQFPTDQQPQVRVMLSESLKGVVAQVLCKKIGGGRVAALEILLVNNAVAALIRDGKTFQIPSIMQTGKAAGMVTMNDSLLTLVQTEQVAPLDAYVKAVDKAGLLNMFKNAGIPSPV